MTSCHDVTLWLNVTLLYRSNFEVSLIPMNIFWFHGYIGCWDENIIDIIFARWPPSYHDIGSYSGVATGGNGGVRTPPFLFRPLLGSAQIRWKVFFTYRGGTPCMYIVTFTAHQQRNMVRTPPLFWGWRRHWGHRHVMAWRHHINYYMEQ